MQEFHGHTRPGGRVSASGLNKMADATARNALSRLAYGMRSSMGLVSRPAPQITGTSDILRGHWPLSSADGDEDISGHDCDCTFVGDANTTCDCLQLDGTGDYASVDAHVAAFRGLGAGTISFWMKPSPKNNTIPFSLTHGTAGLSDGSLYLEVTQFRQLKIYCHGVLNAVSAFFSIILDRWVHVVYVSDATGNALYIDGVSSFTTYTFGTAATQCFLGDATPDADDPADTMRIGELYYNSGHNGQFMGGIADFRIYSRALTQAEIIDIYHSTNRYVLHANEIFGACRIFEVKTPDPVHSDGVYHCYEQRLDATEWDDTAGDSKVDDITSPPTVEVLNLAEFDPEATYVAHLAAGDLLLAFRYWDDEANFRWVGVPFYADTNEGRMRRAFVKTTPTGTTVDLYLDSDASSVEVTITPDQAGTAGAGPYNLDVCIPRVLDGDPLTVYKKGGSWYCTTIFQPIDHAKGLRVEAATEKLAVNIDTTQMQFDAADDYQLKTNLDECP